MTGYAGHVSQRRQEAMVSYGLVERHCLTLEGK